MSWTWSPVSSLVESPAEPEPAPPAVNKHHLSFLLHAPQVATAPSPPQEPQEPLPLSPPRRLPPPTLPAHLPAHLPYVSSPLSSTPAALSCRECSFVSHTPDELALHIRLAHKAKPFACKVCHKTFAERGNANKHFRVAHLKQRNHKCQTCDRSFAFRDGLNRHISMVHLNQRPFECTECMCPRGPHHRAVPCTHICGMRFKQKSHRRRHVLSVHHAAGKRVAESGTYAEAAQMQLAAHHAGQVS